MNLKFINKGLVYFTVLILIGFVTSCTDDDVFELEDSTVVFSDYKVNFEQKGALVIVKDVKNGFYDFAQPNNASIAFTLDDFGGDATSINVYKSYNGSTPVLHTAVNTIPSEVTITMADAANELTDFSSIDLLDNFTYTFDVTTADGTFPSGEKVSINVSCVSDLAGTYTANTIGQSTDGCCPGTVETSGEVTLTSLGGGQYRISDWSGNIYFTWYEIYGITAGYVADGGLAKTITDICNVISAEFNEPFGTPTTLTGSVDQASGVITFSWVTGYADTATVTLTPK